MLEENRQQLSKLMSLYRSDEEGVKAKREAEKQAQMKFVADFERLKHEVIWPAFVDFGNELTNYGHNFHVAEEKEYVDAIASFHPAHITLSLYPSSLSSEYCKPESAPYVSFMANGYAKKIGIVVSTMTPENGGSIGSHGEYEPGKITRDFVEKELIDVLKNSLIFHTEKAN
jgi:hypothetical protein